MTRRNYTLTPTAEEDLYAAREWSLANWGEKRTKAYFAKLHEAAQYTAKNYRSLPGREGLTAGTGLYIYPAGSHYLVYLPVATAHIVIVAVLRQERDIPRLLSQSAFIFEKELQEIAAQIASGEIEIP